MIKPWFKTLVISPIAFISPLSLISCAANLTNSNLQPITSVVITSVKTINETLLPLLVLNQVQNQHQLDQATGIKIALTTHPNDLKQIIDPLWQDATNLANPHFSNPTSNQIQFTITSSNPGWKAVLKTTQIYRLEQLANNDFRISLNPVLDFYYQNKFVMTKMINYQDFNLGNYLVTFNFANSAYLYRYQLDQPFSNDDLIFNRLSAGALIHNAANFKQPTITFVNLNNQFVLQVKSNQQNPNWKPWFQTWQSLLNILITSSPDPDLNFEKKLINYLKTLLKQQLEISQQSHQSSNFYQINLNDQNLDFDIKQLNRNWTRAQADRFNQSDLQTKAKILKIDQPNATNASILIAQIALLTNHNFYEQAATLNLNFNQVNLFQITTNQTKIKIIDNYITNWSGRWQNYQTLVSFVLNNITTNLVTSDFKTYQSPLTITN